MRTIPAWFGSLLVVAITATPALAHNASVPPADEKPAPSACHTMQPGPDGTWVARPCQELGAPAPAKPARRAETAGH